jgi:predicted small lipoprotein YifL
MKKHSWQIIFLLLLLLFMTACGNTAPAAVPPAQAQPQVEPTSPGKTPAANDETDKLQGTLRLSAPPWIFKKFPLEEAAKEFEADIQGQFAELTRVDKWNVPPTF